MVSPRDLTAIWGLKLVQEPKTSTGWTDMNKTLRFRQYPVQYHQNPPRWRTTRCQRNGTPPSGLAGRELDKPERGSRKKIEEKSKNRKIKLKFVLPRPRLRSCGPQQASLSMSAAAKVRPLRAYFPPTCTATNHSLRSSSYSPFVFCSVVERDSWDGVSSRSWPLGGTR